jgi:hypothetical protein
LTTADFSPIIARTNPFFFNERFFAMIARIARPLGLFATLALLPCTSSAEDGWKDSGWKQLIENQNVFYNVLFKKPAKKGDPWTRQVHMKNDTNIQIRVDYRLMCGETAVATDSVVLVAGANRSVYTDNECASAAYTVIPDRARQDLN